jgi:hypothetical protein
VREELSSEGARCGLKVQPACYNPRPPRYPADRTLWLVRADDSVSFATMINVSRDGFGLKVSKRLGEGERVILRGGAGDIPAEIRWSDGDRAGGLFIPPRYD